MAGAIVVLPATVVTNRYHSVPLSDHARRRYPRRGGPVVLHLPLGRAAPADRRLRLHWLRFKIPPVGVSLGVTVGVPVSVGGALGDCPFCTKMVTVEPFVAGPLAG